jgi:hypothetical protein
MSEKTIKTINGARIERGDRATVGSRTYVRFDNGIQVFEQRMDFMVFSHAFKVLGANEAKELIADLRASGCTGAGECKPKANNGDDAEAHGW